MLNINTIKRRDWVILLLVLLVAAVLRLGEPGIVEFFHDEAMLSMLAQEMADGLTLPTTGIISSVGIPNPPITVYVLALPYLFTNDPVLVTLYVAALNVAGVGLLWLIGHRYFSRDVGLIAGLTYALNPWAILYSRKIWAQDFHTPFVLLALLLGLYGFVEGKRWAQILCLPVLLFALQIHFAAWALLPLYVILLWIGWRGKTLTRLALTLGISLLLSAAVMLPYAIGLVNTLQDDPTRISDAVSRSGVDSGLSLSTDALTFSAYMATGLGVETWVAPGERARLVANVPVFPTLWLLIGLLAIMGWGVVWMRHRRLALLLTAWVLLPLFVFTPTWTTAYPHYFVASIPAWGLLSGLGLDALIRIGQWAAQRIADKTRSSRQSPARTVLLAGYALLLLTQGLWWRGMLRYVDSNAIALGPGTSGFTIPAHYLLDVRDGVNIFDDVVVITDGMWTWFDVEAARWPVMLRDTAACVRTLPDDGFIVEPAGLFQAIIAPNAPTGAVTEHYRAGEAREFPTRAADARYVVSTFTESPNTFADVTPVDPVRFSNDVLLTGYALEADRITVEWSLPDAPTRLFADTSSDYQYFLHLLDSSGQRIAQNDASFWPGRHWCSGDRLLSWQTFGSIPDNAATLRVGLYRFGDVSGETIAVDVLDALGNPAGNWVDIPLSQ